MIKAEKPVAVLFLSLIISFGLWIKQFLSCCGLPAPECANNPLGYKFSWSSRGVLLALLNNAQYFAAGQHVQVSGEELMSHANP